ncbi:MAG: 2-C-methyl-D-erythritol 4-phosphate cytidylyltransferase [Methanobrevibacter sp.]
MIFAAILAGGNGTRMGNTEKPKQFLQLGSKPIIIHTIEKFYINNAFEKVIVLTPKEWINHTNNLIKKYIPDADNIVVIEGGILRNDTIMAAIDYIEENYDLSDDDIILTHDSVRPFVTYRIIEENIKAAKEYGACDTVIPATDTIVESRDNSFVSNIPRRDILYQGQTPQSFKILKLKELYNKLTDSEKEILTDACKIFLLKNEKISLVKGDLTNMKITYAYDLRIANAILKES